MTEQTVREILAGMDFSCASAVITQFCSEEDGTPYNVWKVQTGERTAVLKKVSAEERAVYEAFFPGGGGPVPKVFGFGEFGGEAYMLMEHAEGETMSRCTREKLILTLDSLIAMQERFWGDTAHEGIGYDFSASWPNRKKRLAYMGDLAQSYQAYLDAFRTVPRTLCNDDMLPFNVLVGRNRAVVIDWEFGGILPYPCALTRLIAFGEEDTGELFQMSREDKEFAVTYYYQHLIRDKGIGWEEYLRTVKLFLLKEYSEWVYCAGSSGDFSSPYYAKYSEKARQLARELGFCVETVPEKSI